ncbi:MAG: hypothetical protein N2663_04865 [Chlorobi bacterium]|nr:hypothetical protein [Chlorobiota bacterium]
MITIWQRIVVATLGLASLSWFGATLGRMFVVYDLFTPGTLGWRNIPIGQRLDQLRLAENIATLAWSSYLVAIIAMAATLIVWRRQLRQHGYLAIASVILTASLIWQGWISPIELKLLHQFSSRWQPPPVEHYEMISPLIFERFFRRSPADFLSLLTSATIVTLLIVQPRRLDS